MDNAKLVELLTQLGLPSNYIHDISTPEELVKIICVGVNVLDHIGWDSTEDDIRFIANYSEPDHDIFYLYTLIADGLQDSKVST